MTSRTSPCSPGSEGLISRRNGQVSKQSDRSSRTPMQTGFSDPGSEGRSPDGQTSAIYRQRTLDGELASTARPSSPGDSPASRSPMPGSEEARKMTVTSGLKCLELCGSSGPPGCLERMLLGSSAWHSKLVVLTWKVKVTPSGRSLFQLAGSVRGIGETGCSSLVATQTGSANKLALSMVKHSSCRTLFPTPTAPRKHDNDNTAGRCYSRERKDLANVAIAELRMAARDNYIPQMWPTPMSRDYKDCGDSIINGMIPVNGLLGRVVGPSRESGSLNPTWVEWLMGFPIGWTDLDASVTLLSRNRSIRSLRGLHRLRTAYRSR